MSKKDLSTEVGSELVFVGGGQNFRPFQPMGNALIKEEE